MSTPKPVPNKPLTFTPPVYLKGETQPSELPTVESAESNVMSKKKDHRAIAIAFDESVAKAGEAVKNFNDCFDPETEKKVEKPKKPFVLDTHLTQRPFHDDRLMQLKNRLQRPSFKNR